MAAYSSCGYPASCRHQEGDGAVCHLQAAARVRGAQLAVHQPEARVPPGVAGVGGHGGPVRGPELRGVLVPEGAGGVEEVGRHDGGAVGDLALVVCRARVTPL